MILIAFTLNGQDVEISLPPNRLALDMLREDFGLTGAKRSCDVQVCGACTVLVDGRSISSCTTLAADLDGATVVTIEGLEEQHGELHVVQEAFIRAGALQCGFCTPGFVLTAVELLENGVDSYEEIREGLDGNLCRCTGYHKILEAVARAAGVGDLQDSGRI